MRRWLVHKKMSAEKDLAAAILAAEEAVAKQGDIVRSLKASLKDGKVEKVRFAPPFFLGGCVSMTDGDGDQRSNRLSAGGGGGSTAAAETTETGIGGGEKGGQAI